MLQRILLPPLSATLMAVLAALSEMTVHLCHSKGRHILYTKPFCFLLRSVNRKENTNQANTVTIQTSKKEGVKLMLRVFFS
jgi:hypothetical protein